MTNQFLPKGKMWQMQGVHPPPECIVAALDAEMALKGLYRLPWENTQAVVISQIDGKLIVYPINTCRMSINAEYTAAFKQRGVAGYKSSLRFLFTSANTSYTSSFTKKICIFERQVQRVL